MSLPLQLREGPIATCVANAWFLSGGDISRWLEELARCGLAERETQLFVVARSVNDSSPAGVLVVAGQKPNQTPAGMACRVMAGRLYLPVEARLHPPVTEEEIRQMFPKPVTFFHPALGVSAFDESDAVRVWELLAPPPQREGNWNFARHGQPGLPHLSAIVLAQPPTLDDLFGGAEKEIGSEPLAGLPAPSDEPSEDSLSKSRRALRRLFARSLNSAMRHVPRNSPRRTWLNQIEDWANRQLTQVNEQLQRLRDKEIHRLLAMLDSDPEQGLRHAVPMNNFAHRGLAPPGGRLGPRPLEFDPRRLGGGPADFWHVPFDLQEVLRRRYREMADREMQLGRHRRAAYIYAELLGDLVSAAHALKRGRFFREAALLYEEQLRNPLEAARCLAEGGLLAEAIERYEKHERWLEAAELHQRLGNRAAAEQAVRRVVAQCLAQDDILGAAKLVEERLEARDEAVQLVRGAWPNSRQAAASIGVLFELWTRMGAREAALERVLEFRRQPVPEPLALPLLNSLGVISQDFPDQRVRRNAADCSRVLIAGQLQRRALAIEQAEGLMDRLVRLAPEDRLLARDANRHLAARRSALLVTRPSTAVEERSRSRIVRRIQLPEQIEWVQLQVESNWFFALGATPKRLTLVRGTWDGDLQSLSWNCPAQNVKHQISCEPTGQRGKGVALAVPGHPFLEPKVFPAADLFFNCECQVGTPFWLPPQDCAFSFGTDTVWSVHQASGRAVISCHDKLGNLQGTEDVTNDLLAGVTQGTAPRLCLTALAQGAALAFGNRLVLTEPGSEFSRFELPSQAIGLCSTLAHTRQGVAVRMEQGAAMYWRGADSLIELDRDLSCPHLTFVSGGPCVLASGTRLMLLDLDARGVRGVTRMEHNGPRVIALACAAEAGQLAALDAKGVITVYQTAGP